LGLKSQGPDYKKQGEVIWEGNIKGGTPRVIRERNGVSWGAYYKG